jgi:uncharacterized membrane protein YidH (DUF202 family)
MTTSDSLMTAEMELYRPLVDGGYLSMEQLRTAWNDAAARNIELARVLRHEHGVPRRRILEVLSEFYHCAWAEYDERLPVPPELLACLDVDRLCAGRWFPIIRDVDTVVIAAANPQDPLVLEEASRLMPFDLFEFRVALSEDIEAFIQDFLNFPPEHLIGNERTALAYWRNTMARWRTKLACYRTDFAKARTHLSMLRGGLGFIIIARTLLRVRRVEALIPLYWMMVSAGLAVVIFGISSYFRIKKSVMRPPRHQTLVEVTAATLYFLEGYQFIENKPAESSAKRTMLARLADMLPNNCVFIEPSLDNKVRSYLAHERTSLAAQRTVAGCYRTIYARARTGLSFIRTGVAFMSIGLGLIEYFGLSMLTILDSLLIVTGLLMVVDGGVWYWPIRREQCEAAKCAVTL